MKTLSNNTHLLEMPGTRLKDNIVGDPLLPVKTAKIFIPAREKVVSIEIGYGALTTIEGAYLIQHALTPLPVSHQGPVVTDKPNAHIYESDAAYPPVSFHGKKPQFLRGVQVVPVDLIPVLYHPARGTLHYLWGDGSQNHNGQTEEA